MLRRSTTLLWAGGNRADPGCGIAVAECHSDKEAVVGAEMLKACSMVVVVEFIQAEETVTPTCHIAALMSSTV